MKFDTKNKRIKENDDLSDELIKKNSQITKLNKFIKNYKKYEELDNNKQDKEA